MSQSAARQVGKETVGFFNYLEEATVSSLYRNGKVRMCRNADGSDSDMQGVVQVRKEMAVCDGRSLPAESRRTLSTNGFELLEQTPRESALDFLDQRQLVQRYYPECARIVEQITGGRAFAFDHNVRSAQGKKTRTRIKGGQEVQEPIHVVHGDYTLSSGPQRLRDLGEPPSGNDTLRSVLKAGESLLSADIVERALAPGGRFGIVNVWRNIGSEPVAAHPLALCDGQSVDPQDLVVFEIHYQNRIGENYFAKHANAHHWYYYPQMTPDEVLLIKQWDSAGAIAHTKGMLSDSSDPSAPCTFSFHSAFEDPATPADAPDRQSIEVRCIVIFE